jgi:hypothetical protein
MNPAPFRDSRSASQLCSEPVDESTTYSWITFLRTFACKLCSPQGSRPGDCSYSRFVVAQFIARPANRALARGQSDMLFCVETGNR